MKNFNIITEIKKHKLIYTVMILYLLFILVLMISNFISINNFISNLALLFGWIIVLNIALLQLQKSREDNQNVKREEIRKNLEIDAFREVNKARHYLSDKISNMSVTYLQLPSDLKMHFKYPKTLKFNILEIEMKIRSQIDDVSGALVNFILTIESNEIALIKYHYYRLFITFRVKDIEQKIRNFLEYFSNTKKDKLLPEESFLQFKKYCKEIDEDLFNISSWLHDYRIDLMNSTLGDIFESKIPIRKPMDPKYKTLIELATKEKVEEELKERGNNILNN